VGYFDVEAMGATGMKECPFKLGEKVVFTPNEHAMGWSLHTFERARLKPGDSGVITRIESGMYLYLDDGRGGFHWECFSTAISN
jgi:hypothetical protein